MMRSGKGAVLILGLLFVFGGVVESRAGQAEASGFETLSPLQEKSHKVLCSYFYFGTQRSLCGDPPLEQVKKRCDAEATGERGEKTECACTQDPNYIKDACDGAS